MSEPEEEEKSYMLLLLALLLFLKRKKEEGKTSPLSSSFPLMGVGNFFFFFVRPSTGDGRDPKPDKVKKKKLGVRYY